MRRIKIFPAPHVEIRVHVSDQMIEDYRDCAAKAEVTGGDGKDCETCSWREVEIENTGLCEFLAMKQLLEEDQNETINT